MKEQILNGSWKTINGKPCIYYDGYWIRRYDLEPDDLATKKQLIDKLTRRVFHHLEPGINTPGSRLEMIRKIHDEETDPAKKRVKGAMLAGALVNRGKDILTKIVDLEADGVTINSNHELLRMCGECFTEALELGKNIKLANGEEGLGELWGEPFKVLFRSMEQYYESRYIKVAQTMSQIDQITNVLTQIANKNPLLKVVVPHISEMCDSAKLACETLRSDPVIFEVWPRYVAAKEALESFKPVYPENMTNGESEYNRKMYELIKEGGTILTTLSTVRVPMPKSVANYMNKCGDFLDKK